VRQLAEVFWRFLALGCVSFGGPAAHMGYFQNTFVQKLKWLDQAAYARLISLSQFLPGPGSSQIGFALGLRRAGILGGFTAFLGFTLPSFLLMYLLAITDTNPQTRPLFSGIIHGFKLLAVVVVADATLKMFRTFCKEKISIGIAALTASALLWMPGLWTQMGALLTAAAVGAYYGRDRSQQHVESGRFKWIPLLLFILIFAGVPLLSKHAVWLKQFAAFYHSGSLVFGGGHVVLPLLQQTLGESVDTDRFLLGYAAAQAVPGPMFSLAAFLGSELSPGNAFTGALVATAGIFLPGFLLVISFQGAWESLASRPGIAGAAWGINAAVVGLLFAALYQPVFISAVVHSRDLTMVLIGFFALHTLKLPLVALVAGFGVAGLLVSL